MTSELSKYLNEQLGETTKLKLAKNVKDLFDEGYGSLIELPTADDLKVFPSKPSHGATKCHGVTLTRQYMEKQAVLVIENCWCSYRDRHMYRILRTAISSADHTLTHGILRKINPKEAELLNDPVFKARIRFRFAGGEFPPYIVFKIFIQTNGQGMKYLCGKKVIKSSLTAATDSCQLMGNRKYLDQLMMDICDDNQHEINYESDVTNLKDYMKYISTMDEKDALAGGKGNTWRKLTLEDVPRSHLIYDVITYLETTSRNILFKNFMETRGKIMPLTQSEQVDFIHYVANSKFITKSVEPSRRSRQTRNRVSRMKKMYMQEENNQTNVDDRVNDNREDSTKNCSNNVEVAIDDETYNVMLKEDIDISDERWDEEGKYLFEWTRNLSFDSISLR